MATTTIRKSASFRLRADLPERLKMNATRENRTLNNYVESVLLGIIYREPNDVTKAAINEVFAFRTVKIKKTGPSLGRFTENA